MKPLALLLVLGALPVASKPAPCAARAQDPLARSSEGPPDLAARVAALEARVAELEGGAGETPRAALERARERHRQARMRLEAAEEDWLGLAAGGRSTAEDLTAQLAARRQALAADLAISRAEVASRAASHQDLVAEHGGMVDEVFLVEASSPRSEPLPSPNARKILLAERIFHSQRLLERLEAALAARESELAAIDAQLGEAVAASLRSARLSRALRDAERSYERALEALLAAEDAASGP